MSWARSSSSSSPDTFGSLAKTDPLVAHQQERESADLLDHDAEEAYLDKVSDSFRPDRAEFNRRIVKLLSEGDLAAALNVLDVDMKREERSPLSGHYR